MPPAPADVVRVSRFNIHQSILKKHSIKNAFSFVVFLFPALACAQSNTVHQSLYWLRYYNQTRLSTKYTLHVEVDERRFVNPDLQSQFFIHAHLHREISKNLDTGVGLTYANTNSNKNNTLVVPEWRPFLEVSFTQLLFKKIQGQLRYRVDERYIRNNTVLGLADGYNFILRHRFRLQFVMPLKKFESDRSLMLKVADEIMLNSTGNANTFDQNRIYVGVEWQFCKKWSGEFGYFNLYQTASANEYFDRDILRFTLYHRLSLVKNN